LVTPFVSLGPDARKIRTFSDKKAAKKRRSLLRFPSIDSLFPTGRGNYSSRFYNGAACCYLNLVLNELWNSLTRERGLSLIAGPCVIESEKLCLEIADCLKAQCQEFGIAYVFKASFDKANRSAGSSFRGPGLEDGLRVLARVREKCSVPVLTDIHTEEQAALGAEVVDVLQIPAFLCRQTDLIHAAVRSGKIVNVKKGQFLAPQDMRQVLTKAAGAGGKKILLTERGTTFGYNNLVADMRSIPIMKQFGFPVIFDATHSVQLPGGAGDRSSGQREFAPVLAKAAVAAGANGLFIETHPDPDKAQSDGPNMVPLAEMRALLKTLVRIHEVISE
jgi:2-dehydro-3-deoxyphosphooctonate aldolase (KDO 8-P synthase)